MKHAYLIIAHNEFAVLSRLVESLDDERCDIYIHLDRRVRKSPEFHCHKSQLYVLENRVRSVWGDVSLAEVELNLLEAALSHWKYDYFHIISGTHFPVKSLNYMDLWYSERGGANVMMPMATSEAEIKMKIGKYHFFLLHLVDRRKWLRKIYHFMWLCSLALQKRHTRDVSFVSGKASQWCSLNYAAACSLAKDREKILQRYRRTFCCDEFFVRSYLEETGQKICFTGELCYVDFVNTAPRDLTAGDYDMLVSSKYLFARKVTGRNMELVDKLVRGLCER